MNLRCVSALIPSFLALGASTAVAQNHAWIQQFGGRGADMASASAPDGSGGVYVSGITDSNLGAPHAGGVDVFLARYDRAGSQIWIRQFGSSAFEKTYGAAPDGASGVYVAGGTIGNLSGPQAGGGDAFLARYDSGGNRIWIRQFGTGVIDVAYDVATDGIGGAFVSGTTAGNLAGAGAGSSDVWLAHYD